MAELIFVVIALLCLFGSAEASCFFLAIAASIVAIRRTTLARKVSEQEEKLRNTIDEVKELRQQLRELRAEKAPEVRHVSVTEAEVKAATQPPAPRAPEGVSKPITPSPVVTPTPAAPSSEPVIPATPQPHVPAMPPQAPKPPEAIPVISEPTMPAAPTTVPATPPKPTVPPMVPPQVPAATVTPAAPPHPVAPLTPTPPRVIGHISSVQPSQASLSTPPVIAPMRANHAPDMPAAPSKPAGERLKSVLAFEEILGTSWLNRIGIVLVVLGMAWLGTVGFNRVGPLGKVLMTLAAGAGLLIGGILFEKRERYRILGHTGIGGGWALLFFTTYAAGHVNAMRILASPVVDAVLMLIVAAAMGAHTLRYKSQLITGLAFLLGYSTIALSQDTVYSLTAGAILALGLVVLVVKLNWYELEVFGIVSSYLNHLYWLYTIFGSIEGAHGRRFAEFWPSTIILLFYWLVFRASYVVRKIQSDHEEHVSTFAALLNTMLLLGVMKFQSARPELAFYALLALGALEFALGQLPITKRRRTAFVMLSVMGAVLMIVAVPFRYSGSNNALLWLAGAEAFLAAGIILKEKVFRRLGLLTALIAPLPLVYQELTTRSFFIARWNQATVLVSYGVLFLTLGIVYYLNSQFVRRRWDEFEGSFESGSLLIHSYLGGIAMALGAWSLLPMDWTVLGWGGLFVVLAWGCSRFDASDLLLQSSVLAAIAFSRAVVLNLRADATHSHRLSTVIPLTAAFYLSAWFLSRLEEEVPRAVRDLFAWAGTALLTMLVWRELPWSWTVLGWALLALLLVEAARLLKYRMLLWHVHVLWVLVVARALTVNALIAKTDRSGSIPVRLFTMLAVAAVAYVVAKRIRTELQDHFAGVSAAYTWAAAALIGTVIWLEVPRAWVAVSWMVFGLALTFIGRRLRLSSLCYQENVFALAAILATILFNYGLEKSYGYITLRVITVALVAAGLYVGSRKSYPSDQQWTTVAYAHTWAATGLLAALAYFEFHASWLAMVWAAFALVLTIIDRRLKLSDLRWQAHTLSLITAIRVVSWNLYDTSTVRGLSLRLISLAIVVIIFYVLARIIRMPDEYRQRDVHHIYSWTASMIAGAAMWYELQPQPLAIAVAWGIFGLLLVQSGLMSKIKQLRFQGYVALAAAFTRIFFSNLTASRIPGQTISLRLVTVGALAVIIFYIYSQLEAHKSELAESRFKVGPIFCFAGTITVAALLYFELEAHADWIATAWSALVLVLFALALVLSRNTFLHQGLLLAFAVLFRAVFHNLFGGSYFNGTDWTGRYVVLGSAVALLFLTLFFAFRLRTRSAPVGAEGLFSRMFSAFARHPEQVMFFLPFVLLTLMLALKLRAGMVTVGWGIEAVLIFVFALSVRERSYRLTGLLLLLVCVAKILVIDIRKFQRTDQIITCIILGALLMAISFLYSRYREAIRQLL